MDWVQETMLQAENNINEKDLSLYAIVDTADEAILYIEDFFKSHEITPNF